jgi:hypothetical protein
MPTAKRQMALTMNLVASVARVVEDAGPSWEVKMPASARRAAPRGGRAPDAIARSGTDQRP